MVGTFHGNFTYTMKEHLGYGIFGIPEGLQVRGFGFVQGMDIGGMIDLPNRSITTFRGSGIYGAIRSTIEGLPVIILTRYEFAKEINADRSGAYYGSFVALRGITAPVDVLYTMLSELLANVRLYVSKEEHRFQGHLDQMGIRIPFEYYSLKESLTSSPDFDVKRDKKGFVILNADEQSARSFLFHTLSPEGELSQFEKIYASVNPKVIQDVRDKNQLTIIKNLDLDFRTGINRQRSESEQLGRMVADLKNKIHQEETRQQELKNSFEQKKSEYEQQTQNLKEQFESQKEKFDAIESKMKEEKDLLSKIEKLKLDIEEKENQIKEIEATFSAKKEEMDNIRAEIAPVEALLNNLEAEVKQLEQKRNTQLEEVNTLDDQIGQKEQILSKKIEDEKRMRKGSRQESRNWRIWERFSRVQSSDSIASLKKDITTLEEEKQNLESELSRLHTQPDSPIQEGEHGNSNTAQLDSPPKEFAKKAVLLVLGTFLICLLMGFGVYKMGWIQTSLQTSLGTGAPTSVSPDPVQELEKRKMDLRLKAKNLLIELNDFEQRHNFYKYLAEYEKLATILSNLRGLKIDEEEPKIYAELLSKKENFMGWGFAFEELTHVPFTEWGIGKDMKQTISYIRKKKKETKNGKIDERFTDAHIEKMLIQVNPLKFDEEGKVQADIQGEVQVDLDLYIPLNKEQ